MAAGDREQACPVGMLNIPPELLAAQPCQQRTVTTIVTVCWPCVGRESTGRRARQICLLLGASPRGYKINKYIGEMNLLETMQGVQDTARRGLGSK